MKVFTKTVELTEAQIEDLNTGSPVPLVIVTAPRTGYALGFIGARIWKTAGNAATAGTGEINVSYGTSATAIAEFTNVDAAAGALGNNAQNRIQHAIPVSNAVAAAAQPLTISSSAAIAAATGTKMKISIDFTIVKL